MKKRIAAIAMLGVGLAFLPVPPAKAATTDPVLTVTAPTSVVAGQTIAFDLTINAPGYAPSGSTQKVTWTNPLTHATYARANYTVIPMTTLAGPIWHFTYVPGAADIGHTLTFSVPVCVSTARICRTISGVAYFEVLAVSAPEPVVTEIVPSTLLVGGTCHAYLNAGNGSAYAYCYQYSTVGYKSMFLQIRCQDGSYHQGVRVFTAYAVSQAYCAAGQIVTSMVMYFNLYS